MSTFRGEMRRAFRRGQEALRAQLAQSDAAAKQAAAARVPQHTHVVHADPDRAAVEHALTLTYIKDKNNYAFQIGDRFYLFECDFDARPRRYVLVRKQSAVQAAPPVAAPLPGFGANVLDPDPSED